MKPILSIIVPVYDVEKYINKCIDSILKQTFTNFELILIDDSSPDNCGNICDKYAKLDSRIKVIHKENGGLSSARNVGIDAARGEYIGFVDSDDYIKNDMYESLYKAILKYKADISICGKFIVGQDKVLSVCNSDNVRIYNRYEGLIEIIKDKNINSFAWDKLYKRELFDNVRYPEGRYFEDIATTYKLFMLSNKIVHINSSKYYYLQREDSICGSYTCKKSYDHFTSWYECLKAIKCLYPKLSNLYKDKLFEIAYFSLNNILSLGGRKSYSDKIKSIYNQLIQIYPYIVKNKDIEYKHKILLLFLNINSNVYFILYPKLRLVKLIIKKILKRYLPSKLKNKIKYNVKYLRGYQKTKNLYEKKQNTNRIFIIGTPDHDNLGDQAIAYAEYKILKRYFKDYEIKEISTLDIADHLKALEKNTIKHDIFALQGGGNMGDEYLWEEEARRKIISKFPNNKIVIFPQTIYFKDNLKGKKQFKITKKIYNKHKHLTIVAREKTSYNIMKDAFVNNNVILTPDVVMYLNGTYPLYERKGALLCIRNDREGILSEDKKNEIRDILKRSFIDISNIDTLAEYWVDKDQRKKELNKKWSEFKKSKLVITDRLHGMIFSAITSTPCIVLSNYNYKVKDTYKWLENLNYIKFCENIDEIDKYIEELKNIKVIPYDNSFAKKYYKQIIDSMKESW